MSLETSSVLPPAAASDFAAPFSENEFNEKASWAEMIVTGLVTTLAVLFVSFLAVVMAMS